MKRVLIVGANGLLGSELARGSLQLGWEIDVLVHQNKDNLPSGIRHCYTATNSLAPTDYDYIFNTAAYIPYGKFDQADERLLKTNIDLAFSLSQVYPQSKLVFASSVAIYGKNTQVINERSESISPNLYGLTKLIGERISALHQNYSVLRFPSLYGPGMTSRTFLLAIAGDAINKGKITLLGDGKRRQNYLHISDAAQYCIQAALEGDNEVYLGTAQRDYSNAEVAEVIRLQTGCNIAYSGIDETASFEYDNRYTTDKLKFYPKTSLEDGIKELLAAYQIEIHK